MLYCRGSAVRGYLDGYRNFWLCFSFTLRYLLLYAIYYNIIILIAIKIIATRARTSIPTLCNGNGGSCCNGSTTSLIKKISFSKKHQHCHHRLLQYHIVHYIPSKASNICTYNIKTTTYTTYLPISTHIILKPPHKKYHI